MMPVLRLFALLAWAATVITPRFENIAGSAGLGRSIPNGGDTSKRYIIETTGSGVALFDYDNDDRLDILLVSGPGSPSRLYRNLGNRKFTDVTKQAGFTRDGWGQGVCAGDFDNDGFTDVVVTYWGGMSLYRNIEGKQFKEAGIAQNRSRYNSGCAFLDYDRDGDLDLFVANYLQFDLASAPEPGSNPYCWYRGIAVNCGPRGLPFDRNLLYRNDGNGGFVDVSEASGIALPNRNYALGVLTGDFNGDGWTDIYVACDRTPSLLYVNEKGERFREEALLRGAALDENGQALSGMGATAADYDGDGRLDIFRTNFSDERETLYRNTGNGNFEETTHKAGFARNTTYVGWGCGFFDFDNDGWKDLLLVNGHVFPEVDRLKTNVRYKERAILYRNQGDGTFQDISEQSGPAMLERHSARGAAFGDIDNDGSLEVVVNNQNERPSLIALQKPFTGNWISWKLTGTTSNRSAIGAVVRVTAGGRTQIDEVRSGGSYLSHSDLRLHFGLGSHRIAETVEIRWPNGLIQKLSNVPGNQTIAIKEAPISVKASAGTRPQHRRSTRGFLPK